MEVKTRMKRRTHRIMIFLWKNINKLTLSFSLSFMLSSTNFTRRNKGTAPPEESYTSFSCATQKFSGQKCESVDLLGNMERRKHGHFETRPPTFLRMSNNHVSIEIFPLCIVLCKPITDELRNTRDST